jgi:general secretion pathway protein D
MRTQWHQLGCLLAWSYLLLACVGVAWAQTAGVPPTEPVPVRADADGRLTLDLRDVELASFVNLMGKLNGLVTVMGDDVKTKVTVFAPKSLSMDDAFLVLEAVLDAHGLTLIRTEKLLKVVKKTDAVQKPVEVRYGSEVDSIPDEDRVITQVVPVVHVEAKQLLEALRPLVSSSGHSFANDNTNALVVTDIASNIRRLVLLAGLLDKEKPAQEAATTTVVYPVRYMKAKDLGDALEKVYTGRQAGQTAAGGAPGGATGDVRLTPVEAANSIIVTASPALHTDILQTIESLDVRRLQVLIEARIVEASFTETTGFSTAITKYLASGNKTVIKVAAGRSLTDPSLAVTLTRENFEGLIHALATDGKITILSCPRLLTTDNQKAKITVGQEQPILKSVTDLGQEAGAGKTVSDFVYKDVGINLEVTPRINVDRDVALDITMLITSVLSEIEFPGNVRAPLIGKREAQTSVIVKDGDTLVIGGLIGATSRSDQTGIPYLSRIPGLGWLLGSQNRRKERTELLVFITPYVVATSDEGTRLTQEEAARAKHIEALKSEQAQDHE